MSVPSEPKQRPAAVATPEPLGGCAGPEIRVPRILRRVDFWMMIGVGAFGLLQLAEDDGAGVLQPRDHRGVLSRTEVAMDRHAVRGRRAFGPAKILHRDRHAVQRSLDFAGRDLLLGSS